jgi:hypothetical protein
MPTKPRNIAPHGCFQLCYTMIKIHPTALRATCTECLVLEATRYRFVNGLNLNLSKMKAAQQMNPNWKTVLANKSFAGL